MKITGWLTSLAIALTTSAVAVFLSSVIVRQIPIGSIIAAVLIIIATRYLRNHRNSFWQSTLVIICWGLITFRAATPTSVGDLILIDDKWTWWYVGITGIAALISLVVPAKPKGAESLDEVESQNLNR